MSSSTDSTTADAAVRLEGLRAEARYRRERLDIYRAKAYGSGEVTEAGMRLRERECESAEQRLHRAESETAADQQSERGALMGDILSIAAIAVLLVLIVDQRTQAARRGLHQGRGAEQAFRHRQRAARAR